jgi:hypothetical protein
VPVEDTLTHERAAERLLEDERLRSDLTDDEARVLLDWALAELSAAEARGEPLSAAVDRIRTVARQVNDLVGARADLDARAFAGRLRELVGRPKSGPARLARRRSGARRSDPVDDLVHRLPSLDGPDLVRAALALVSPAATEVTP